MGKNLIETLVSENTELILRISINSMLQKECTDPTSAIYLMATGIAISLTHLSETDEKEKKIQEIANEIINHIKSNTAATIHKAIRDLT